MKVYLAPHHDDLLLSIPGHLRADPEAGESAVVVVFSRESEAMEHICSTLHERLGFSVHTLGLTEARLRGVSLRGCFRVRRAASQVLDDPLLQSLEQRLGEVLSALGASRVLAPLLSVHLDHALTRVAAERRVGDDSLVYYEDQPYGALWPRAAASAKMGLERVASGVRDDAEELASLFDSLLPLVPRRDLERIRLHLQEHGEGLWTRTAVGGAGGSGLEPVREGAKSVP